MHDIKFIRNNFDFFEEKLKLRGVDNLDKILKLDKNFREVLTNLENLRFQSNAISKKLGEAKKTGKLNGKLKNKEDLNKTEEPNKSAEELIANAEDLKKKIQESEATSRDLENELKNVLISLPNIPSIECQFGINENDNVEILKNGERRQFSFVPKPHEILGQDLKLMDFKRSSKLSGSRFVVLYGGLAKLERAIAQFMLDIHTKEFGYMEVSAPLFVKEKMMFGTGQLPKFRDDQFKIENHDLWAIPTGEVTLTNLVNGEILEERDLPMRYVTYTPCFRAEAGSAGKDVHGMIRNHQFSKVELVCISTPDQSVIEHEYMTKAARTILEKLEIPYRVMKLCTGDMGFCAELTYDIEAWIPSQNTYREISSCSRCSDFQARRMNTRYRSSDPNAALNFVHTLNGSGLAVGRTLVAILENYQNEDGSITVPNALIKYMGCEKIS